MNANRHLLEILKRSDMFQTYERAFAEAVGMPLALRPVETWQLPLRGKRRENPFCALVAGASGTCAACLQMQEKLAQSAMERPFAMTCAYGLSEMAVPVKLGTRTIGFLQTGQVLRRKPCEKTFQQAVAKAGALGVDLGHPKAREAYFATPVLSRKKLESVSTLLRIFAEHLA